MLSPQQPRGHFETFEESQALIATTMQQADIHAPVLELGLLCATWARELSTLKNRP